VLVHGAWADETGWQQVVQELHRDGYNTVTPTLALESLEGDVAIVRAALDGVRGQKLLVAHSYGGFVVSNAALGRSDVVGIVYTAAFVPDEGDSIVSLGQGFIESAAIHHLIFTGEPWASPSFIDPAYFHEIFAADLSQGQAAEFNDAQIPANPALLVAPSGPGAWHDLPTWYAISDTDLIIDPAQQRWMAERAGATIIEFKKASHVGGYTVHAKQFSNLIVKAARSARR
jgi:pimeloyl-ACP methyl ester carboxylesterase